MTVERKVGAGALAGALSIIIVWLIGLAGLDIPAEVASAFTTVMTFFVSWWVPSPVAEPGA